MFLIIGGFIFHLNFNFIFILIIKYFSFFLYVVVQNRYNEPWLWYAVFH